MASIVGSAPFSNASATSIAGAPHASTQAGDVLLVALAHDTAASLAPTASEAAAWGSAIYNTDGGGSPQGHQLACYAMQLAGSPAANYTFESAGAAANFGGVLITIRPGAGETLGTIVAATIAANPAATITTNAVTGVANPSVLVGLFTNDANSTVVTPPSGMTRAQLVDMASSELDTYTQVDAGEGSITKALEWSTATNKLAGLVLLPFTAASASAAFGGTLNGSTEQDVRDGGKTLTVTLTDDTWLASGATFDAQRQNILDGLASSGDDLFAAQPVTSVVRTSDTVVTITLAAVTDFQITGDSTVTGTIPATALAGGNAIDPSGTVTISRGADDLVQPVGLTDATGEPATSSGSITSDAAGLTRLVCTIDGVALAPRVLTKRTP